MKKYNVWSFVTAVVLLPMGVFAVVKWYQHGYTKLPVFGGERHTIANFNLVDQYGARTSLNSWEDKIVVAGFFFTHCPVVCPKMTRSLKKVQLLYSNEKDVVISSFSVDPERDSATQLKKFAERMDIKNNWQLITGDKKEIYKLARNSFKVVATDGDGGPNDFIHSELLVLVDKQKRIRGYYNGTDDEDVNNLLRDIDRLLKEYR